MKFEKYRSIENSYRLRFLEKMEEEGAMKTGMLWHVNEKIHGSNFSFLCDGKEIKCAKRTGFLKDDDSFFHFQKVKARYYEKVMTNWRSFDMASKGANKPVRIFGELFGGRYNHPDVERVQNVSGIQKEVHYCPDIDFIAYDIMYGDEFIRVSDFNKMMPVIGIPYLPSLFSGTFKECLEYSNEFQTTIPAMYGLPSIDGNICEGVVIRPNEPLYLIDGSRIILKNKNEKFSERNKEPKKPKEAYVFTTAGAEARDEIMSYINTNRLKNIISHIGEIEQKGFGKLMGLFTQDIIKEYLAEHPDARAMLMAEWPILTKTIGQESANFIRPNFQNIVDGTF